MKEILIYHPLHQDTPGLWDPHQSWHSSNTKTPGTNRSGFATNTTDSLIQIIRTSSDVQERDLAYKKFQAILYEEQPQIFYFPLQQG
ncbi:MAG: hypothetical protein IPH96_10810 [Saprospiraceae bacterium]|nr:hypothetical protein [Saprospiraceae bacterium]